MTLKPTSFNKEPGVNMLGFSLNDSGVTGYFLYDADVNNPRNYFKSFAASEYFERIIITYTPSFSAGDRQIYIHSRTGRIS